MNNLQNLAEGYSFSKETQLLHFFSRLGSSGKVSDLGTLCTEFSLVVKEIHLP